MRLPKTAISQDVVITRVEPGHYSADNTQWIEDAEIQIATVEGATIVPIDGKERASSSLAGFNSNHKMHAGDEDITFLNGYAEFKAGDTLTAANGKKYLITFPGFLGISYFAELKLVV
jgi:hypothetical protein